MALNSLCCKHYRQTDVDTMLTEEEENCVSFLLWCTLDSRESEDVHNNVNMIIMRKYGALVKGYKNYELQHQ